MRSSFLILLFLLNLNIFLTLDISKANIPVSLNTTSLWKKIVRYTRPMDIFSENKRICKNYLDIIIDNRDPNLVNKYKNKNLYRDCHFDIIKFKDQSIYILFSKLLRKGHNKMVYNAIDINNSNRNLVALISYGDKEKIRDKNLREHRITNQFSHLKSILKPYNFDFFPNYRSKGAVISIYDKYETTLQKFANKKSNKLAYRWNMIKPIIEDYEQLQSSLIHRDIKFGNIVCKALGISDISEPYNNFTCVLIDFEFSLLKEEWQENKSISQMLGTTVNLAPELFNRYSLSKQFWAHLKKRETFSFGMILLALFGFRTEYEICLSFLRKMYNIQKSADIVDRIKQRKNEEIIGLFSKWFLDNRTKNNKSAYLSLRKLLLDMVNPSYIQRPELHKCRVRIDNFISNHPLLTNEHQ